MTRPHWYDSDSFPLQPEKPASKRRNAAARIAARERVRARERTIGAVIRGGERGPGYARQLAARGTRTPADWQRAGCPPQYLDTPDWRVRVKAERKAVARRMVAGTIGGRKPGAVGGGRLKGLAGLPRAWASLADVNRYRGAQGRVQGRCRFYPFKRSPRQCWAGEARSAGRSSRAVACAVCGSEVAVGGIWCLACRRLRELLAGAGAGTEPNRSPPPLGGEGIAHRVRATV